MRPIMGFEYNYAAVKCLFDENMGSLEAISVAAGVCRAALPSDQ
jgi:hypothetical protein